MALPPKGDPRRPLHLAVRLMRVLGIIMLTFTCLFGMLMGVSLFMIPRGAAGMRMTPVLVISLLFYLAPGVCFMIFAHYLKRRQFWAVIASICIVSFGCLFALFALVVLTIIIPSDEWQRAMLIPIGILLIFVVAFGQLIYLLCKCFEAIKHSPPGDRGFEPLMAQPIGLPPVQGADDAPPSAG